MADLALLARIFAAAFPLSRPWSEAELESLIRAPGALFTSNRYGFALGRVAADQAEISSLAVDPAHRRRGHGRALLAAFEAAARDAGAREAFLDVAEDNHAARALYGAACWRETGRRRAYYAREHGPAADALCLHKVLG